jgi:hypothetical protein
MLKNNRNILVFAFLAMCLSPSISTGQNCDCQNNLTHLINKVENNYAGFNEKVTEANELRYNRFKKNVLRKSKKTEGINCFYLLMEFTEYFRDPHLSVSLNANLTDTPFVKTFFRNAPVYKLDTDEIYNSKYNPKELIEGVWTLKSRRSYYRVLISQINKKKIVGVVLASDNFTWHPGQIKFQINKIGVLKYKMKYFLKDHSYVIENVKLFNPDIFDVFGNTWRREFPRNSAPGNSKASSFLDSFYFSQLTESTNILALPSFSIENKRIIDSLLIKNEANLKSAANLIIDLRNNTGGSSASYSRLFKYFYTNPIKHEAGLYKSSDDIIEYYRNVMNDTSNSVYVKMRYARIIDSLLMHKGELVDLDSTTFYRFDSILPRPKRIGIIINEKCGSAAELFLLNFMQSKKTVTFGETTRGAIDYANALNNQPLLCSHFQYNYPIAKRKNADAFPIDNVGIKPDVFLSGSENEWIDKVLKYLERQ